MEAFEQSGPVNTASVIAAAKKATPGVSHIVVASISGDSAIQTARQIPDKSIICVTCPQGMAWEVDKMQEGPFQDIPELAAIRDEWISRGQDRVLMNVTPSNRQELESLNVRILQGTIPFFGPSFSIRLHLKQATSLDVIAKTLELISTGTLVCLECVLMAADAGLIPEQENVLALAGTEKGLDTAWIIRSSTSANLFHPEKGSRFIELLAKPAVSQPPRMNIEYLR